MRLDRFLAQSRIIELQSRKLPEALKELVDVCRNDEIDRFGADKILNELLDREKTMSSYLGNGVALPHIRLPIKQRYVLALGRCPEGLEYDGSADYNEVRILLMLLASEEARGYLNALATIAQIFQDPNVVQGLLKPESLYAFRRATKRAFAGDSVFAKSRPTRINRLILREAEKVARSAGCEAVMIFGDTFVGGIELGRGFKNLKTILITQGGGQDLYENSPVIDEVLPVRSFSNHRMSQMRSAILVGMTRGIIRPDEQICCVGGIPQSNSFDTILVLDVGREFRTLISEQNYNLPQGIRPEVMERILAIATELGLEGREGKPVGSLFILGDHRKVLEFSKPLILNPFFGYKEEDRNILNPFMDETVKELSTIDGAFIIRGNGVIEAAGALVRAPLYPERLPGGLGARHAAAAAITMSTKSIAIVVSASNGQVSLFSRGDMIPLLDKAVGSTV